MPLEVSTSRALYPRVPDLQVLEDSMTHDLSILLLLAGAGSGSADHLEALQEFIRDEARRFGSDAVAIVPRLVLAFESTSPTRRVALIGHLAAIGGPEVDQFFTRVLISSDPRNWQSRKEIARIRTQSTPTVKSSSR